MAQKLPLHSLEQFLPTGAFPLLKIYFDKYPIKLSIKRERRTVLGDYRPPQRGHSVHRISVNGNLNPQHFLITLLHEIAHLLVYVYFKTPVKPHGDEWKKTFALVLHPFLEHELFAPDVKRALQLSLHSPAASSCSDPNLYKVLLRHDKPSEHEHALVESLPIGTIFKAHDGKCFEVIEKLRTRYKCRSLANGKFYLFPGLYHVAEVLQQ